MNDGQRISYSHDFVDEKIPLYFEMFEDCAKLSAQPVKLEQGIKKLYEVSEIMKGLCCIIRLRASSSNNRSLVI